MILSNVEIQRAIDEGDLVIEPEPLPRRPDESGDCPFDTTTVNLHLGPAVSIPRGSMPFTFDLRRGAIAPFLREVYDTLMMSPSGGFALQPGQFALGQTTERVGLRIREGRPCLAARIEGRSSFARCGLIVHFTAPTIHAGFDGKITLEMKNLGDHPITLYPGLRIAQLVVEQVLGTSFRRSSQFAGQELPTGPTA